MNASGLIVEYNPLHNGHIHHIQESKKASKAECIVAVMSGSFLQRGEPAIIDKFYRTKAALKSGVDIMLELPYPYAVQSSHLFAKGAVQTLYELGVSSICFGSESGNISDFIKGYQNFKNNESFYQAILKKQLNHGFSYPKASELAQQAITQDADQLDLTKPNNILGYSYVKTLLDNDLPIEPLTIKRSNNNFHDQNITSSIASATSIRKQLIHDQTISFKASNSIPDATINQLNQYKANATTWHTWEYYFPLVHYRVMTMTINELSSIHGVDEGLEFRIKQSARKATSFDHWITLIKTKRYTHTRLQRMFVHILTNTKKTDLRVIRNEQSVPYIRLLGMTKTGRSYLNKYKKSVTVPIITQLRRDTHPMLEIEEKVSTIYYSILSPIIQQKLHRQELEPPIIV